MRICFDLDETLCTGKPYEEAEPILSSIEILNRLKEDGHIIIIYTARGMTQYDGDQDLVLSQYGQLTKDQLNKWGINYDSLIFGKPSADIYVDDKALNVMDIDKLEAEVDSSISFKQCCEKIDGLLEKINNVIFTSPLEDDDGRK